MTKPDTIVDKFLDKHPKLDEMTWKFYRVKHEVRDFIPRLREKHYWKPGSFYLDHGHTPCVLIEMDDDALVGINMVTGDILGGCSIYHCGPVKTTRKDAIERQRKIRSGELED